MNPNLFHKTWGFNKIGGIKKYPIYQARISFNILKRFCLGFEVDINSTVLDWKISLFIFNLNGHFYFTKNIDRVFDNEK